MKKKIERTLKNIKTETRENAGERWIVGTIPYNSKSENLNPYGSPYFEIITPSAFNKTLADNAEVRALFSHDNEKVLGSTKSGTLILENTPEALICSCKVPNTSWGNDCWEVINRGDITTMSFGFIPFEVETQGNVDYLKSVKLEEVSFCVANPAYKATNSFSSIRSLIDDIEENKETLTNDEIISIIKSLKELLPEERENKEEKLDETDETKELKENKEETTEAVITDEQSKDIPADNTDEVDDLKKINLLCEIELNK